MHCPHKISHVPPMCVKFLPILAKNEILKQNAKDLTGLFFKDELGRRNPLRNWDVDVGGGKASLVSLQKDSFFFFLISGNPGIHITL